MAEGDGAAVVREGDADGVGVGFDELHAARTSATASATRARTAGRR